MALHCACGGSSLGDTALQGEPNKSLVAMPTPSIHSNTYDGDFSSTCVDSAPLDVLGRSGSL